MESSTCNYVPQGKTLRHDKRLNMHMRVINAKENRDAATTDIPGAYLNAEIDNYVIMVLEGSLAELLVKTTPNIYRKYSGIGKDNKPVLYVQLKKALYGCLKSAFLFYKQLLEDLQKYGFIVNPYNPCVAIKMVKGKQLTMCWHVDDLKISHKDNKEVTRMLRWLESKYCNLCTTREKVHEYFGMTLDFSKSGKVKVIMSEYLKEIIEDFPEVIQGTVTSSASAHLFNVDEKGKLLDEILARQFHTSTAKLIFVCKRARPDIQTAVAFLTTQVKFHNKNNWKKLRRVILYLNGALDMALTLSSDNLNVPTLCIQTCVDIQE
eukprot:15367176-Ditylum_brightwellii.AAC.4